MADNNEQKNVFTIFQFDWFAHGIYALPVHFLFDSTVRMVRRLIFIRGIFIATIQEY